MVGNDINGIFDQAFCWFLANRITEAFAKTVGWQYVDYWCDGVGMPPIDSQLNRKSVNDTRKMETVAWTGRGGNTAYQMTIKFGRKALSRYARSLRLEECVPDGDTLDWITIDDESRTIEIRLK